MSQPATSGADMSTRRPPQRPGWRNAGPALWRTALLWGAWVVLVEARPADLLAGVPLAGAAALLSLRLTPPGAAASPLRLVRAAVVLAPRVAWLSLVGGLDVARRAFGRRLDLDPGFIDYTLDPPDPRVALGLSYLMTVMPGTLAADVAPGLIRVHVLDRAMPVEAQLRLLEARMRAALGGPP